MTTTMGQGNGRNRKTLMLATAAAFLAAVLFASTAPAHAKDHGHKNHGRKSRAAHVSPHHYTVPHVLTRDYRGSFQPYYKGRAFYRPHNHYHVQYRLPVYYGDAVVYRPYAYCGDQLFVSGVATLPRLALSFNFGAPGPGLYVGGYYATPPPAPYYYDDRHYHDDHDHDDCHHGH